MYPTSTTSPTIATLRIAAAALLAAAFTASGSAQGPSSKPFQDVYRRPAVSPYLQLQQQGMNPLQNQNIYQTMVQPQVQQQQQQIEMLNQRRQLGRVQGQVQQMQQSSQARQLNETIRPTGHASTYMNYSHYYPQR
jgi:Ca2+-dependent lipid-binding protein